MKHRVRLVLLGAVVLAGALAPGLIPAGRRSAAPPPQPDEPNLRIQHELVSAPIVHPPESRPRPSRRAAAESRPRAEHAGLMERAQRLLLGSGRYRPEPFPRAGQ